MPLFYLGAEIMVLTHALKGASDFEEFTASLKRCLDTKLWFVPQHSRTGSPFPPRKRL